MELSDKHNAKSVMRAPPRRRIKTEDGVDDLPLFLRKAFVMMSQCPPEIGGWSVGGDSVVIKDVKQFSDKIIPTAYKHNNFSSFVRQLNFYGFRKVKSELLEQSSWWEFKHPLFLRDQPHLLSEIKRSIHYETPSGQEVNDLKSQVGSLNDKIELLNDQIEALTSIVNNMQLNQSEDQSFYMTGDSSITATSGFKKRKISKTGSGLPDTASFSRMCSIDESRAMHTNGVKHPFALNVPTGPELQSMNIFRQNSLSGVSLSEMDAATSDDANLYEDLESLQDLLFDDLESTPIPATSIKASYAEGCSSSSMYQESIPHASVVASAAPATATTVAGVQDLFSVLETLSPELKIRFVDKLAEVMGKQLTASLPTAGTTEASAVQPTTYSHGDMAMKEKMMQQQQHEWNSKMPSGSLSPSRSFAQLTTGTDAPYHLPSGVRAPEIALPLASAALGAFVMSSLNSLTAQSARGTPTIKQEVV